MVHGLLNRIDKLKWAQSYISAGLLLSVFFPVRKVFEGANSSYLGEYSDFLTFSLYLSYIFTFLLFLLFVFRSRELPKIPKISIIYFFALITGLLINFPHIYELNLKFLVSVLFICVSYGTAIVLGKGHTNFKMALSMIFVGFSVIQSIIVITQFLIQRSIGLFKLGEPHIDATIYGVAKIVSGGTFIRGYGTFPHPNVLSIFLLMSIILNIWLILNENRKNWLLFYWTSIVLTIFAIILTFSRLTWLALALGGLVLLITYLTKFGLNKKLIAIFITLVIITSSGIYLFKPFLISRVSSFGESSSLRNTYNKIGIKMIQDSPLLGVGAGESMLHMQQYAKTTLKPWEIRPIHNYFLLSASEFGLPITILLIILLFWHLYKGFWKFANYNSDVKERTWYLSLSTILFCFMLAMFFDHYFYTLMQGQFLLWFVLGLLAASADGSTLNKKEATD